MNVKRGANMKRKLWKSPYFRFNNPEQYTPENNNEIVFAFFLHCGFFPEQSEQPIVLFFNEAKANEHKKRCKYERKTLEILLM
jgi:hypothetical protein